METEDILRNYKLREPSVELNARIYVATRGAWARAGRPVEFGRSLWRTALGLAASMMFAVIGAAINSAITEPAAFRSAAVSVGPETNFEQGVEMGDMMRRRFAGLRQPVDVAGLIKRREVLEEELRKGS